MKGIRWLSVVPVAMAPMLGACGGAPPADTSPPSDAVGPAVRAALNSEVEARYFDAAADLNGDGKDETVVYATGPAVCGTGGCPVFVFTPTAEGLRLVGDISAARPPVRRSPNNTQGWSDLVVAVGGGGLPSGNVELAFDGTSYPSNATVPPAKPIADLNGTEVLIADFDSSTAGKIVPPAVLGDAAEPVAGSVLGTEIHAKDAEGLRFYVLRQLTDRYVEAKGIGVTQDEIDAYLKRDSGMPGAGAQSAEDQAAHEESAGAFIWQWKTNKALYEQYGGRIIFQQGGPEPLDAYRRFLEEAQARGEFEITNPALEGEFWRYYRDDSIHSFYPAGSPEEKRAFADPPWAG